MRIAFVVMTLIAAAPLAHAAGNGEHPAIVARRVIASQGFDHAAAFYRHPAGLELAATAPAQAADRPAPVLATRNTAATRRHR